MLATYPANHILLVFVSLVTGLSGEEYELRSFLACSLLRIPIITDATCVF